MAELLFTYLLTCWITQFKKIKKEAHEAQFAAFELYQKNELSEQVGFQYEDIVVY